MIVACFITALLTTAILHYSLIAHIHEIKHIFLFKRRNVFSLQIYMISFSFLKLIYLFAAFTTCSISNHSGSRKQILIIYWKQHKTRSQFFQVIQFKSKLIQGRFHFFRTIFFNRINNWYIFTRYYNQSTVTSYYWFKNVCQILRKLGHDDVVSNCRMTISDYMLVLSFLIYFMK